MYARPTIVLCAALSACAKPPPAPAEPMAVLRISPAIDEAEPPLVFLNQDITVYLSQPIDPLSVTADTVRVVDEDGHRVPGTLRVWARSVTFEPVPPVTPTLDDGSLAPDRTYRLEIPGLPLHDSIRARSGARLVRTRVVPFRTVGERPLASGLATPLLPPTGAVGEPFGLEPNTKLVMAADTGRLELHFGQPVSPQSVGLDAVRLLAVVQDELVRIAPTSVRVLPERRSPALDYGSTVEVRFDTARIDAAGHYCVELAGAPAGFRDYLGRPLASAELPWPISVVPGHRVRLAEFGGTVPWRLDDEPLDGVGFLTIDGRLEPACRVEAGTGSLGWLRPRESTTIRPGEPFELAPGRVAVASTDLEFAGIDIPEGVVVTLSSAEPIRVRSRGPVRVRGRLVIDAPPGLARWAQWENVDFASVLRASGCAMICGGDVRVDGSVEHARPDQPGSPLTLLTGGDLMLRGRMPTEVAVGVEAPLREIHGPLESPVRIDCRLTPGVAAPVHAEAWTDWLRLPADHAGPIDVELESPRGAFEVEVQIAPPHSVDPERPDRQAHRLGPPQPVGDELRVGSGAFVRFHLRVPVVPGERLPSLGGIRVLGR